jgi:hypothetical protein
MNMKTVLSFHACAVCLGYAFTFVVPEASFANNLLINSDFSQGNPGEEDFGWTLAFAEDQQSACTVVEGHLPRTRALRMFNDQRSSLRINQQISVRPWRWYMAEVWVKSDGMYSPDVRLSLKGGRKRGQWQYNTDYFHKPESGWRAIRAFDHSGENKRLTLSIGGSAWSGDLLISKPVVRECSLVEAASYHANANSRSPIVYGPPVDPTRGLPGYAFLRNDVRRVAKDFPNALRISVDLPDPRDPENRISLWLPPGIRFLKLRPHGGGKRPPRVTTLPSGADAPGGTHLELYTGRGESNLLVESDLEPGERATGYVSYEWNGGYQNPRPIVFEGVELPTATAPKRMTTAFDVYGAAYLDWEGFQPDLTGQQAMVRDMKRMGFNRLQIWGGDARPYASLGIEGAASYGGSFTADVEKYPDSGAVMWDGKRRSDVMCPSYRGSGFKTHPWLQRVKDTAAIASAVNLDDEVYLMSGAGPNICFCDRCVERWDDWVAEHRPGLAEVIPQEFFQRAHQYPQHYEAWVQFRCDLVAERYGILRKVFHDAIKKSGVKTTPRPELGAFTGEEMLVALSSVEALSRVLDFVSPMIYTTGEGVRREVAKIGPISGGKLVVCLAPGYLMSPPGDVRSQVLEAVMGGSRGFVAWNYDIGPITTGHMADMAEAIKMFSPVEDIILDGEIEAGYTADKNSANLLARKHGAETVLVVSDYYPGSKSVKVTAPGESGLEVVDLFTDEVVARLDATQRTIDVILRTDFQARLYHLKPPEQ